MEMLTYDEKLGTILDERGRAVAFMNDASGLTLDEQARVGRLMAAAPRLVRMVNALVDTDEGGDE